MFSLALWDRMEVYPISRPGRHSIMKSSSRRESQALLLLFVLCCGHRVLFRTCSVQGLKGARPLVWYQSDVPTTVQATRRSNVYLYRMLAVLQKFDLMI